MSIPIAVFCVILFARCCHGHGYMKTPPSRSSMWRDKRFPNAPRNYDDNQLFCGGRSKIQQLGGMCGPCGDSYDGERENEAGGKYATGIITETYPDGATMLDVEVVVTAYHKGYYEFRICPHNNPSMPVSQECLNDHLMMVKDGDKKHPTRYYPKGTGSDKIQVYLPRGMKCSQCVVQWRYRAGNSWGTDPDGSSCLGCGVQEEFRNCADISIGSEDTPTKRPRDRNGKKPRRPKGNKRSQTTKVPVIPKDERVTDEPDIKRKSDRDMLFGNKDINDRMGNRRSNVNKWKRPDEVELNTRKQIQTKDGRKNSVIDPGHRNGINDQRRGTRLPNHLTREPDQEVPVAIPTGRRFPVKPDLNVRNRDIPEQVLAIPNPTERQFPIQPDFNQRNRDIPEPDPVRPIARPTGRRFPTNPDLNERVRNMPDPVVATTIPTGIQLPNQPDLNQGNRDIPQGDQVVSRSRPTGRRFPTNLNRNQRNRNIPSRARPDVGSTDRRSRLFQNELRRNIISQRNPNAPFTRSRSSSRNSNRFRQNSMSRRNGVVDPFARWRNNENVWTRRRIQNSMFPFRTGSSRPTSNRRTVPSGRRSNRPALQRTNFVPSGWTVNDVFNRLRSAFSRRGSPSILFREDKSPDAQFRKQTSRVASANPSVTQSENALTDGTTGSVVNDQNSLNLSPLILRDIDNSSVDFNVTDLGNETTGAIGTSDNVTVYKNEFDYINVNSLEGTMQMNTMFNQLTNLVKNNVVSTSDLTNEIEKSKAQRKAAEERKRQEFNALLQNHYPELVK